MFVIEKEFIGVEFFFCSFQKTHKTVDSVCGSGVQLSYSDVWRSSCRLMFTGELLRASFLRCLFLNCLLDFPVDFWFIDDDIVPSDCALIKVLVRFQVRISHQVNEVIHDATEVLMHRKSSFQSLSTRNRTCLIVHQAFTSLNLQSSWPSQRLFNTTKKLSSMLDISTSQCPSLHHDTFNLNLLFILKFFHVSFYSWASIDSRLYLPRHKIDDSNLKAST